MDYKNYVDQSKTTKHYDLRVTADNLHDVVIDSVDEMVVFVRNMASSSVTNY